MSDGLDRYEHFNMARHTACTAWWGPQAMAGKLAAASGVSNTTDAYVVQVLAAETEGQPVENPRQIPAYRYSSRYGPKPPCFARATVLNHPDLGPGPRALLAGTAAVRGEDSQYIGDLAGQFQETCRNLASLIACAEGEVEPSLNGHIPARLAQIQELRVYVSEDRHVEAVLDACDKAFEHGATIEWMVTGLCRPELWVEIEGIAALDPA